MLTLSQPKRYTAGFRNKGIIMRQRKVIKTTLGDLVAAVMDEVKSLVGDPSRRSLMASFVLNDLLTHQQRPVPKRSRRIY
ncbi:MAG TPA: hypothetical protein VIE89_31580 [Candidatus Binatia bacterium]|jgi:hypothetical protein